MNATTAATRRMSWLGFALIALTLPACLGPRGAVPDRVAYRPVATSLRGRPFYVSSYGGADYSPSRPRKVRAIEGGPTYVTPASPADSPAVSVRQGTWDEP